MKIPAEISTHPCVSLLESDDYDTMIEELTKS